MVAAKSKQPSKPKRLPSKKPKAARKRKNGALKRKKKRVTIRPVSRRSIIKGAKTAWIYFCNERRPQLLAANPKLSFGDVCKQLAPVWTNLTPEEKAPYVEQHIQDKKRFKEAQANLTPEQIKHLKRNKRHKRQVKRFRPKAGLSPYMFYVITKRSQIAAANSTKTFQEIGKLLGATWNSMTPEAKSVYEVMSQQDKKRYEAEHAEYVKDPAGYQQRAKEKYLAKKAAAKKANTVVSSGSSGNGKQYSPPANPTP